MVLGEQAFPVRSEVAAPDTRNALPFSRDRRGRYIDDDVHLVDVVPLARDARADVGFVEMVRRKELDLHALRWKIGDRHARGHRRSASAYIGIKAGHIRQNADLDDAVGNLRLRTRGGERERRRREYTATGKHGSSSLG